MNNLICRSLLLSFITALTSHAGLKSESFINPPDDSRPMTWMHIMDSNASKEGMEKDLKAMADVGVGGVFVFSVSQLMPYGDVAFNSREFRDILLHGLKVTPQLHK